jgi:hypothetical protein
MQATSMRNLKANTVLIGLVFSLGVGVVLLLAVASMVTGWHLPHWADQGIGVLVAGAVYLFTRMRARRAYLAARSAGHLTIAEGRAELVVDHPESWLIHLYVELHMTRLHVDCFVERPK